MTGECFKTPRPTTYDDPTYVVENIVHYCLTNMPGAVPLTSSQALNNATLPFGLALADEGLPAMAANPHLRAGLHVHKGHITNEAVANSLNLPFLPADQTIAA
jgi:alanine dehydrogenase